MYRKLIFVAAGVALFLCAAPLFAQQAVLAQMYGSGVHAYFSHDYHEAYDLLNSSIAAGNEDPRCYYFRGLTYLRLGRSEDAELDFQHAGELEAKDTNHTRNIGRALERIQGNDRIVVEKHRTVARMVALKQEEKRRQQLYGEQRQDVMSEIRPTATIPDEPLELLTPPNEESGVFESGPLDEVPAPTDATEPDLDVPIDEPTEEPFPNIDEEPASQDPTLDPTLDTKDPFEEGLEPDMPEPDEPVMPEPDEPVVPEAVEDPFGDLESDDTSDPAVPEDPEDPVDPDEPAVPEAVEDPFGDLESDDTSDPAVPEDPEDPVDPVDPDVPEAIEDPFEEGLESDAMSDPEDPEDPVDADEPVDADDLFGEEVPELPVPDPSENTEPAMEGEAIDADEESGETEESTDEADFPFGTLD